MKSLWRISVATTPEAEDAVSEMLASAAGAPASAYFDLKTQKSRVSVYLESGKIAAAVLREKIAAGLRRIEDFGIPTGTGKGMARVTIVQVKREDWAESWKRHFKPMEIKGSSAGSKRNRGFHSLLIKPSWSRKKPASGQAVVILDPGLSFGTGQHPTTSFCLHQLVRCLKPGVTRSFLDIGTGSGILAIAAAKLGFAPVEAFDFDPASVRVASENIHKNGVAAKVMLTISDITKARTTGGRQFDLVCANLMANLLIQERRRIVNRVKPGGTLVLAGILAAEFGEVERAYAGMKLRLRSSRVEKEWRSGAFCFD